MSPAVCSPRINGVTLADSRDEHLFEVLIAYFFPVSGNFSPRSHEPINVS